MESTRGNLHIERRAVAGEPSHARRRIITKRRLHYVIDFTVLVASFTMAYLLRFDFELPDGQARYFLTQLPCVVVLQMTALSLAGVYTFIWRYVGMSEIRAFANAALWSALPVLAARLLLPPSMNDWRVPISICLVDTTLAFGGALGLRVLRRAVYERANKRQGGRGRGGGGRPKPVLLIGAGHAGMLAAKEIRGRGDTDLQIKGFVDDDRYKTGLILQGVRVLGTTADLPRLVRELEIDHVILTVARASRRDIRRIVSACEQIPIKIRVIPDLFEILHGHVEVSHIRDIEIEDLLGREPVELDFEGISHFIGGKAVMVTGAGGSIGSELARQVARFNPSQLILIDRAEPALFQIDRAIRESLPALPTSSLVTDVGDEERMRCVMAEHRPQVILHAAAHKHVPMMESNAAEAIKNNVLATYTLGRLAGEHGAEVFVLISTDKAVRPTSVMGASKRMAELAAQSLGCRFETRYVAVRFGNVIGSTGSVIPIFREQIRNGGPITVTHEQMTRYFMTIPEAAQLVLQAGGIGRGGEIFILDMGEPVRILDLALDTITLSGLKPYEDIDIVVTGVRPGEKLFEELAVSEEQITKTLHPKIYIGNIANYSEDEVAGALGRLGECVRRGDEKLIREIMADFLPEARLGVAGNGHAEGNGHADGNGHGHPESRGFAAGGGNGHAKGNGGVKPDNAKADRAKADDTKAAFN
ncbi:MAG TPA: nucleoside-diphosphate sugar epimerase/dehydratase [Pyrinomonadaceae bacterium]|nr:nucleoside-diphosphate sugar epimerase/dehydratase [Pyrinomonadaceae bacterium]